MRVEVRARVLVQHGGHLLLLPPGGGAGADACWTLPGGGWEGGETLAECAAREVREETGVSVEVGPVAFLRERPWVFRAPGPNDEAEVCLEVSFHATPTPGLTVLRAEAPGLAQPQWVSLAIALRLPLWPDELRPTVERLAEAQMAPTPSGA